MRRFLLTVAMVTAMMAGLLAAPANATYVGTDGRLAFVRANQIYTATPAGRDVKQLTDAGRNTRPKWSPDGTRIAFLKRAADGTNDVWVMAANGTQKTRVTTLGNVTAAAVWSPDGDTLAFAAGDNPTFGQLYTIAGHEPFGSPTAVLGYQTNCTSCEPGDTTLVPVYVDQFLAWSPDGSIIVVFNHDDAQLDDAMFAYHVATSEAEQIAATGAECCGFLEWSDLAWGSDGSFGYGEANTGEFDGTDPFVHIVFPGFNSKEGDRSPAPSPSNARMAFTNPKPGHPTIYVATITGAHRHIVTRGYQPDWQPLP